MRKEMSQSPVFIAGCGRSGTSFLRTVIDAHPDVYIPSESLFIVDYLRFSKILPKRLKNILLYNEPQLKCWYDGERYNSQHIATTIRKIHEEMAAKQGAYIWGQKTPRFIRYRQLFEEAFGTVRWLLIYRDPRAVAASMRVSGQHTHSVVHATRRWLNDNNEIAAFLERPNTIPENVLTIKYETLIDHFDDEIKGIFNFIGISPISREYIEENANPVFFSQSGFSNNTIRNGITPDTGRIESWRKVLTIKEIAYIENKCSREMKIMGYERVSSDDSTGHMGLDLKNRIKDAKILLRYLRYWPAYLFHTLIRKTAIQIFRCFRLFSRKA